MQPKRLTLGPMTDDADGIAEAQTPAGAGGLTLNGDLVVAGVAYAAAAQTVSVVSDGDDSGIDFTVTGTDANGNALTETLTGPNNTTVRTDGFFLTVTEVSVDGAGTGNITVGWEDTDGAVSATIPTDTYQNPFNMSVGIMVDGTVSVTIQHTFYDVQDASVTPVWLDHPSLAAIAATSDGNYAFPVTAVRAVLNSGTGSALVTFQQAGMPGRG